MNKRVDNAWYESRHGDNPNALYEEALKIEKEMEFLKEALERIAGTTMSHVLDYSHGFSRCREIATEALDELEKGGV